MSLDADIINGVANAAPIMEDKMKNIVLFLLVFLFLFGCSKSIEPVSFETELSELCDNYGYEYEIETAGNYVVSIEKADRDFSIDLGLLADEYGYMCATSHSDNKFDYVVIR